MKNNLIDSRKLNLFYIILGDLAVTIIKGPIGVIVGIVYGFIMGISLWYLPAKDCVSHVLLMLFNMCLTLKEQQNGKRQNIRLQNFNKRFL